MCYLYSLTELQRVLWNVHIAHFKQFIGEIDLSVSAMNTIVFMKQQI